MNEVRHEYRSTRLEEVSTPELVRGAAQAARRLVQAELALAKQELREQQRAAWSALIWSAVAFGAIILSLSATLLAVSLVSQPQIRVPSICAIATALLSLSTAFLAYRSWPRGVMTRTRERLKHDVALLRKHTA
jgi:uncharacterized membrane protein YqjE